MRGNTGVSDSPAQQMHVRYAWVKSATRMGQELLCARTRAVFAVCGEDGNLSVLVERPVYLLNLHVQIMCSASAECAQTTRGA